MVVSEETLSLRSVLEPPYLANPYPLYHRLREADPVQWDPAMSRWVVTRYADVMAVSRDARFSSARGQRHDALPAHVRERLAAVGHAYTRQLLYLDPPDHTRLRKLVGAAFTPRVVATMRARVAAVVEEVLAEPRRAGRMDLIAAVSYPLPMIVIAELLGVPATDRDQFAFWAEGLGVLVNGMPLPEAELVNAFERVAALMEYLRGIVARHRVTPAQDLLQALIDAEDAGDVLTEDELLFNAALLLTAGYGTTAHLLGNGLLALLRHREQLERLRADPALLPGAVMELLRYDGPIQAMGRVAAEDVTVAGKQIARGERVLLVLGAANHDPARFPEPDRLDVTRDCGQHVAFGHGPHYCVGAPLARLEAELAFGALLRLEDLRLEVEEPVWRVDVVSRGLVALPIAFRPQREAWH
jgi:cytochrome P450